MRGRSASSRRGATAAGVGALSLLAQLPLLDRSIVPVDEGQLLAIAQRLGHGEVLYRDVYTGIFPGIYWAAELALGLGGGDAVAARWLQALVNAATAVCLWLLARRAAGAGWAALAPLFYGVLVALGFPGLSMLNYSPAALLCALAALLFLLRQLESGRALDGLLAGVLLGGCVLTKQNFGALAALALAATAFACRREAGQGFSGWLRGLAPTVAGGAAVVGVGAAALVASGAFPDFVEQTLLVIYGSQLEAFNDPIPPIVGAHPLDDARFVFLYTPAALYNYLVRGEALFGLPIAPGLWSAAIRLAYGGALATLAAGLGLWFVERKRVSERARASRALVIFSCLLFPGIFPSAIWSHLAFVAAPLLAVAAVLGDRVATALARRGARPVRVWRALAVAVVVAALLLAARISLDVRRWYPEPLGVARASLFVGAEQRTQLRAAVRFLTRCAGPGDPVFVAPDLPVLYFLADRRNPTPYDLVIPGHIDEELIIERLEATGTRCVVYNPQMYLQFAPFEQLFPRLASHLATRYRRAEVFQGAGSEWHGLVRP